MLSRLPLVATLVISSIGTPLCAGPDELVLHFMNSKPTMLDFGILRLDIALKRIFEPKVRSEVFYEWEENKIIIDLVDFEYPTREEAKSVCEETINRVREFAGYDESGELIALYRGYSSFSSYFGHNGFLRGDEEEYAQKLADLDQKFRVYFTVSHTEKLPSDTSFITCTAPLEGTGVSIRDW